MADLLVDTDVFIDHLRGKSRLDPAGHRVHYSVVTRAELFAGSSAGAAVRRLLAPFRELVVDRPVAERAGRIRRAHGLRLPDALIAASALHHGLALVTRNSRDFDRVPDLDRYPPPAPPPSEHPSGAG